APALSGAADLPSLADYSAEAAHVRLRRVAAQVRSITHMRHTASRYSMISLARASTLSGIVTPNALAVVRLITRSNLVGCSTGRSDGFAPRRILSTWSAARRKRSGKFGPYDNRPPVSTSSRKPYIVGSRAASAKVLMRTRLVFTSGSPQT